MNISDEDLKPLNEFGKQVSKVLQHREMLRKTLYPFDEIVRVSLVGFIERNIEFEDGWFSHGFVNSHLDPILEFLVDKEQDWMAEKTLCFIAELNKNETEISEQKKLITPDELFPMLHELVVRCAKILFDIYRYPYNATIGVLRMNEKHISPEFPSDIKQELENETPD